MSKPTKHAFWISFIKDRYLQDGRYPKRVVTVYSDGMHVTIAYDDSEWMGIIPYSIWSGDDDLVILDRVIPPPTP